MNKERNRNQNHSGESFKEEELVDGIFDKSLEWFVYVPWTLLYQELVPLQHEGKITGLHYKTGKDLPDEFAARFFVTDKIKGGDLMNIISDYLPSEKEEKSRKGWTSLARQEAAERREHSKKLKKDFAKRYSKIKREEN